jgi:transcription elongation GreA/GreB family factor
VHRIELSAEARTALEERLRTLDDQASGLKQQWAESRDPAILAALGAVGRETARLREALIGAKTDEGPHDAAVVELGDTVTIRMQGGPDHEPERFKLVSELEARVVESWISVEAPVGRALLGRRVRERVDVDTPNGSVRYEILSIDRDPP